VRDAAARAAQEAKNGAFEAAREAVARAIEAPEPMPEIYTRNPEPEPCSIRTGNPESEARNPKPEAGSGSARAGGAGGGSETGTGATENGAPEQAGGQGLTRSRPVPSRRKLPFRTGARTRFAAWSGRAASTRGAWGISHRGGWDGAIPSWDGAGRTLLGLPCGVWWSD